MKLRVNKFTLSCVAVLSSAILFGVNGINVQAADNGTGNNSSAVSSSTTKDEDKPIYSGAPDPVWGGIHWAIYKIDNDEHNLQLRLGNPDSDTVENLDSSIQNNDFYWFSHIADVTSVEIVGNIKTNETQEYLFSSMSKLTAIKGLDKLDTSSTTDFSHMFDGDTALSSVDLSDLDMSAAKDTSAMFSETNISSLTLGSKSVISEQSSIPAKYIFNGQTYSSNNWYDKSNPESSPQTDDDLIKMYSTGNPERTHTTWTRINPSEQFDYYIQYVDSSSGENLPVKSSQTYKGTLDESVNLSKVTNGKLTLSQIGQLQSGYSADSIENETGTVSADGNGGYSVKAEVKKLDPVNISVSQTVGADKPTDASFKIPVNDASYKYSNITAPANSTIDLSKSTIKIGDGTAESFASYSPTSKDLNSVLSGAITSQLKDGIFGDKAAGTTPITVNAVYTKKSTGGGSSSGSHYNNGNNNNNEDNNTEDKGGTTSSVSQTVSTTTKDVNLYDNKGKLITNKALGKDSGWFSDQEYTLDGTLYYRVASNEYVKASDVYVYTAQNNIVRVQGKSIVYMVDSVGHKITDRALSPDTEWYSDRYTMINGQKYYRVATNEFVSAADVSLL